MDLKINWNPRPFGAARASGRVPLPSLEKVKKKKEKKNKKKFYVLPT